MVLNPIPLKGVKIDAVFSKMLRGVIQNYLASKGYVIRYSDRLPPSFKGSFTYKTEFSDLLKNVADVDGVVVLFVHSFSGVNVVFVKHYKLDAEVCLYGRSSKLGCWRDSVSRRNISIATDPIGIAAKLLGSVLSDTSTTKLKTLVMEWAYNISALIPGFSEAERRPKIFRVISNVSSKPFKAGDRLVVAVEGDPGLEASFDIGTFRKGIKMVETSKAGIYQGVYVVQKGDEATNQYLLVKLVNARGDKSEWLDLEPPINIDGIPPKPPVRASYKVKGNGVALSWECIDGTTTAFLVLRSEKPLSGYELLTKTADIKFFDGKVVPGKIYYYRVVALDKVGNKSDPVQVGPVEIPVFNVSLNGTIKGSVKKGTYRIIGNLTVPEGATVEVQPGTIFEFTENSTLKVCGVLKFKGTMRGKGWSMEVCPDAELSISDSKVKGFVSFDVLGEALLDSVKFQDAKLSLVVGEKAEVILKRVSFRDFDVALKVEGGEVRVLESEFKGNKLAIYNRGGEVVVEKSNLVENGENIRGEGGQVIVKESYLGSADPVNFKVFGDVHVVSYLTLPYPDGNVVKFNPEELKKKAQEHLENGVSFIKKGNYGKALKELERAYKLLRTKEVYYWLVYVYTLVEEDSKLRKIIDEALERFPYEVNIYQLAIRYYMFKGKYKEAEDLLDRALKLQPNNPTLLSMRSLLESLKKKTDGREGNNE